MSDNSLNDAQKFEKRDALKFWSDSCHHLEVLLKEQNKIITVLQRQVRLLQDNLEEKPAPRNSRCVCCSNFAYMIAKCGHYFCSICVDRSHHVCCIECEKNC